MNCKIAGTEAFLIKYLSEMEVMDELLTECRKDLGDGRRLRRWSRGHVFIVRSCGHIDTWRPIYK